MNRFAEIEIFVDVIESGSFSAVSSRTGVAVSAISRRVDELESRLGVQLTQRSTRGVNATPEGRAYYERCVRLISDLAEADALLQSEADVTAGLIRIACPPALGLQHLLPLAADYMAEHPGIRIDLDTGNTTAPLLDGGYDFAIRIGHARDASLTSEPLFHVLIVATATPAFWDKNGRPQKPEDLTGLPALVYRHEASPGCWRFTSQSGRVSDVRLTPRLFASNGEVLLEAAKRGLGVCLEPDFVVGAAVQSGELEAVLIDCTVGEQVAELVHPKTRPLSVRANAFANVIRAAVEPPPPWHIRSAR